MQRTRTTHAIRGCGADAAGTAARIGDDGLAARAEPEAVRCGSGRDGVPQAGEPAGGGHVERVDAAAHLLSDDHASSRRSEADLLGRCRQRRERHRRMGRGDERVGGRRRLPTVLLPWLRTSTQPPWAVTLTGPVPPDGAASMSRSCPPSRILKYETVFEAA